MLSLYSWNVNGFRAVVRHGFYGFLDRYKPDVLGVQEIKFLDKPLAPEGYNLIWNPAKRKGYAGTAVLVKENINFKLHSKGIGNERFDLEGRVIVLEFDSFYFVNSYFPNSQHGLTRLDFKLDFDVVFQTYLNDLGSEKPVVSCGDFNVAHNDIDIAHPKSNEHNAGFTKEERNWMTEFLSEGYVDTFRFLHPTEIKYSWWSYRFNARKRNIGWRIDYFVVSNDLKSKIKQADILTDVLGSDHAPLSLGIIL